MNANKDTTIETIAFIIPGCFLLHRTGGDGVLLDASSIAQAAANRQLRTGSRAPLSWFPGSHLHSAAVFSSGANTAIHRDALRVALPETHQQCS